MPLDEDYLSPETPVGVNAEEILANNDENCQVKDRDWSQLPELNAIGKKGGIREIRGPGGTAHGAETPRT
jgi:hypothetical protein